MPAHFAEPYEFATPIHVLPKDQRVPDELKHAAGWIAAHKFEGNLGEVLIIPGKKKPVEAVLVGWGNKSDRTRGRFYLAQAAQKLPAGSYYIYAGLTKPEQEIESLGWLLGQYRFTRYAGGDKDQAELIAPYDLDSSRIEAIASGEYLTRDLINTPTNDMGPEALQVAFEKLAGEHGAQVEVTTGDKLRNEFPLIHTVGRASDQAPRLLDMRWGAADAPKVTLVGKGVCFDTGGLNIKPGASMGLMKKDMGGAANVMGLAHMIMALNLPVRLRVLVPAVENSISAGAFRPSDILTSRKGLTVEINNTDAEGRLVLADALTYGDEESPELLLCMATLTGAARVALGPDLPPFFTDNDILAGELAGAAGRIDDPLWRMPFHKPYEAMIEPGIADLDNAPKGGFAGAITAALFLRRFVNKSKGFAHFDIYGWTPDAKPGRPKGGAAQGIRALLNVLENRYHSNG